MRCAFSSSLLLFACVCIVAFVSVHGFIATAAKPAKLRVRVHQSTRLLAAEQTPAIGRPMNREKPHWYTMHVKAQREIDVYARLTAMCSTINIQGKLLDVLLPMVYVP